MIIIALLMTVVAVASSVESTTCNHESYEKVGCFKRNHGLFTDLLITDLDPTHEKWGKKVDWSKLKDSLHSLACRCNEKAKKDDYSYFTIGYYGECWAGKNTKALKELLLNPEAQASGTCIGGDYGACDLESKHECAGVEDNDYVYEIVKESLLPTDAVCQVNPESRKECGFGGITRAECASRGCCFNSNRPGMKWCYKTTTESVSPASVICQVNPESRKECGFAGITKSECESRGCCFNSKWPGMKWCYIKNVESSVLPTDAVCQLNPESRKECGFAGITRATCESRGCCFNSNWPGMKWCYKNTTESVLPTEVVCQVNPESRIECGFAGITSAECESRGCCFNSKWPGMKWCYKKNTACAPFHCSDPLLEAYYPFRGTWDDISNKHHGKASTRNGNKVTMDSDHITIAKQSYVTMPNVDISTGPWAIHYRIRVHTLGQRQYLLANFRAHDWAFLSWVDASGKVVMYLRTNVPTRGSDPKQDMISVASNLALEPQKWAELDFVWNPSMRSLTIYVNGKKGGSGTVRAQVTDMTLRKSNGDLTWGIKEDSSKRGTLDADIKDFYFYRAAIIPDSANLMKCDGPKKCGKNRFCVGFEAGKVYCYGGNAGCLWNRNDCAVNADCLKYSSSSNKYTDGDQLNCITTPSGWRSDACGCATAIKKKDEATD